MLCMNELRKSLGLEQNVMLGLANAIEQAGGNPILGLQKIGDNRNADLLLKLGGIIADAGNPHIITVKVNRRIQLRDAISKCGFDEVDPRIFSAPKFEYAPQIADKVPIASLCFGRDIEAAGLAELTKKVEAQGRRCIDLCELLAITALRGSSVGGADFALGTTWEVEKKKKTFYVAYIDLEVNDAERTNLKKSLRVVETHELKKIIQAIATRERTFGSNMSWLPVVRK